MSLSQNSFRLPNRQRRTRSLVSLTPLIDVVFILLIFLMLVSNFLDQSAIEISMGAAGEVHEPEADRQPVLLHLLGAGRAELDGRPVELSGLARALADAVAHQDTEILLVRSDRGVELQAIVSAMSAARSVPGLKIFLVRNGSEK